MTDRELLELAAKAYKLDNKWKFSSEFRAMAKIDDGVAILEEDIWNPFAEDGDALRLATYLCMIINTGPCEASASTISGVLRGFVAKEETINQGQDIAVRRAIVRAAAEIGKTMK